MFAEAAQSIEQFFTLLESNPWVMSVFSDPAFTLSVDIAEVDRDAAQRFYSLISRPFASRRFHYLRLLTRVLVAEHLGPEKVVEALAELEPEVIWTRRGARAEGEGLCRRPTSLRPARRARVAMVSAT